MSRATVQAEIEAFNPDFILMFGDDQYENFIEDIIPPFCVMAYDDLTSYPFKGGRRGNANVWGEPADHPIKMQSRPAIAKWLAHRYLEESVDMSYAYKPLHWEGLGHAFVNIQMYLDYDRQGFDFPMIPVQVNSYGSKIIRNRRAINGAGQEPDPPSPTPRRCFEIGQITARILKDSPWRVVMYASGGWSHGFLVEKNHCLWPDVETAQMSRATTLVSVNQQLAVSAGVAVGAFSVETTMLVRRVHELTADDFAPAFVVVALISAASAYFFWQISDDAGHEISGRKAVEVSSRKGAAKAAVKAASEGTGDARDQRL